MSVQNLNDYKNFTMFQQLYWFEPFCDVRLITKIFPEMLFSTPEIPPIIRRKFDQLIIKGLQVLVLQGKNTDKVWAHHSFSTTRRNRPQTGAFSRLSGKAFLKKKMFERKVFFFSES